jgi:hypothetical protein
MATPANPPCAPTLNPALPVWVAEATAEEAADTRSETDLEAELAPDCTEAMAEEAEPAAEETVADAAEAADDTDWEAPLATDEAELNFSFTLNRERDESLRSYGSSTGSKLGGSPRDSLGSAGRGGRCGGADISFPLITQDQADIPSSGFSRLGSGSSRASGSTNGTRDG